jgi:type VI secretion system secreted protein Hcp
MNSIRTSLRAAAAALFLGLISSAGAAVDMFLMIQGIPGESVHKDHRDWIEIESFSWGVSNSATVASGGGGGGSGKANFVDLTLAKNLDKASPYLFLRCADGRPIQEVQLVLRRAGGESMKFFHIKLQDVIITSSTIGGSSGQDRPAETLSLNYGKIEWSYIPQLATGAPGQAITTSWNLATNSAE